MAEDIHKINVRSPFFITATGEGAPTTPSSPSDPIADPVVPAEYVQPETLTQTVLCGETIKVGEDVGGRQYVLNVGAATGNISISYSVNIPISITAFWNQTVPDFQNTGYVGSNDYQQQLLDAGISSGNMSLGSGTQSGAVTINKTAATPETVTILVSAPLPTDDYQLTFGCPSAPDVSTSTLPSSPSLTNGTFIDTVAGFYVQYVENANIEMKINDVLIGPDYIDANKYYVLSNHSSVGPFAIGRSYETSTVNNSVYTQTTPTTYLAKSTYFNTDVNKIEFTIIPKSTSRYATVYLNYQKGGIVYDDRISDFRYMMYNQPEVNYFNIPRGFLGESAIQAFQSLSVSTIDNPITLEFYYRESPSNQIGLDHPERPVNVSGFNQGRCYGEIKNGVKEIKTLRASRLQ